MSVHVLAGGPGPAMFLGASIMSFALPYAAFIIIASALFILFRAKHSSPPRLKYLASASVTSVLTREPGPVPAPAAKAAAETGAAEAAPAAQDAPAGEPSDGDASEGTE